MKKNYCGERRYDFITIRKYLDSFVYCIGLICKLAERNLELSFLIIGRGDFFKQVRCSDNIIWIDKYMTHEELLSYVNRAKLEQSALY